MLYRKMESLDIVGHIGSGPGLGRVTAVGLTGVDNAESIAFRILHDHVVGVGWHLVPVNLDSAERHQTLHFRCLVLGVQVKMDSWR